MEYTPSEDAVKTAEMTTKDLEYYIVDKAETGFKRTDSNFERSSVGKMLLNNITCYRENILVKKSESMQLSSLLAYFKELTATPFFSTHHSDQSLAINIEARPSTAKRLQLTKGSDDG